MLQHLAQRAPRQGVKKYDVPRYFVASDMPAAVQLNFFGRNGLAADRHDCGKERLAVASIRYPYNSGL